MGSKIKNGEHAFWRKLILPEEDRRHLTATAWDGKGYRWFRSPNVIPIEQWRREQESAGDERKVG
jgi:hypothetical protein